MANKSSEDVDVIDVDVSELDTKNANYEYYYVYYDEEGNVVGMYLLKFPHESL